MYAEAGAIVSVCSELFLEMCSFIIKVSQKAFGSLAFSQPAKELTVIPRPLAGFRGRDPRFGGKGAHCKGAGKGKGMKDSFGRQRDGGGKGNGGRTESADRLTLHNVGVYDSCNLDYERVVNSITAEN